MKLQVFERKGGQKGENNALRREGKIPAVLYFGGKEGTNIAVSRADFSAALRGIEPGTLSTTVFHFELGGKERKAVVKDIQYHVTSYDVLHLDFEELQEATPVSINVPIQCVGAADCPGVKLGGAVSLIRRMLRVTCLPKDMPKAFQIDVRDMNIGQSKRLKEVAIPAHVKAHGNLEEVAVVIAKK